LSGTNALVYARSKRAGFPHPILEWLGSAVLNSDQTEQAARAQAIKKLQARYERIEARIETMYMDKLDGRTTQEFSTSNRLLGAPSRTGCRGRFKMPLRPRSIRPFENATVNEPGEGAVPSATRR